MIEVEGAGTNFPPRAQDTFERERLVGLKLICYSNGTRENILKSNSLISLGRLTKNTNQKKRCQPNIATIRAVRIWLSDKGLLIKGYITIKF